MAADSSSCTSRMLLAAAASAAASSLLTYAALRLHGCRRRAAREPQAASSGAALPSSGEVARAAHSDPHDPSPRKGCDGKCGWPISQGLSPCAPSAAGLPPAEELPRRCPASCCAGT